MVDINDPSISMREKDIIVRGKIEKLYKDRAYKVCFYNLRKIQEPSLNGYYFKLN